MSRQKLYDTTLFQLFESCQKVEMKLSKLVTAAICQDIEDQHAKPCQKPSLYQVLQPK